MAEKAPGPGRYRTCPGDIDPTNRAQWAPVLIPTGPAAGGQADSWRAGGRAAGGQGWRDLR